MSTAKWQNIAGSKKFLFPAPKMLLISTEGAHDPKELCKYGYDCQAKGENESRGSHLSPNPRTNKQANKHYSAYG